MCCRPTVLNIFHSIGLM